MLHRVSLSLCELRFQYLSYVLSCVCCSGRKMTLARIYWWPMTRYLLDPSTWCLMVVGFCMVATAPSACSRGGGGEEAVWNQHWYLWRKEERLVRGRKCASDEGGTTFFVGTRLEAGWGFARRFFGVRSFRTAVSSFPMAN